MESRTRQKIENDENRFGEKLIKDLEEEKKERELPDDHAPNSRKRQKTTVVLASRNVCGEVKTKMFIFLLGRSISSAVSMMMMNIAIAYYFRLAK